MKGGFLSDVSNTLSNWGTSISQGATNLWNKTKETTTNLTTPTYTTPTTPTTPTYTSQPMSSATYGGKKTKTKKYRKMRGGFKDMNGVASHAASFSGKTAQPHNWVGGRTMKHRKHKHSKSCRH
jgi:hypothetical protein